MDLNQPTITGCVFCNSGAVEGSDEPVRNCVVNWTHTFRSNLLNEARFGFNAVRFDQNADADVITGQYQPAAGHHSGQRSGAWPG